MQNAQLQGAVALIRARMRRIGEGSELVPPPGRSAPSVTLLPTGAMDTGVDLSSRMSNIIVLECEVRGELVGKWHMRADEMGVPNTPAELLTLGQRTLPVSPELADRLKVTSRVLSENHTDAVLNRFGSRLSLPRRVVRGMRDVLRQVLEGHALLWFTIGEPSGYLAVLDWERLLHDVTDRPVIRLPYHALDAVAGSAAIDVLLIYTTPIRSVALPPKLVWGLIDRIVSAIPPDKRCTIHLFADRLCYQDLRRDAKVLCSERTEQSVVVAEQPSESLDRKEAQRWSAWIADGLQGKAVDIFHLIAPGKLSMTEPLTLAAVSPSARGVGPKSKPEERFLCAADHNRLMSQVGAWGCVFTPIGDEGSRLATRLMVDQIARTRPGTVAFHDLGRDRAGAALGILYQFLHTATPEQPPVDPSLSLYCHPSRFDAAIEPASDEVRTLIDAYREATALARQSGPDAPDGLRPWLAAAQRYLELSVSRTLEFDPQTDQEKKVQEGSVNALKFVSRLIANSAAMGITSAKKDP